ncbi:hypothetical protein LTS08_007699 [Lithohypha guttulata]|uniref:uncharacterized protein n=1 Tax=Lithohypha guttulata TaxID=1690604 RepID=UPI002DDED8EB|nr:hypothetical protein LTR51_008492 [Lithohypha guttulata]KAK5096443.1 hypothetical protein LTS08_007699 [Lithohypha guttulata]
MPTAFARFWQTDLTREAFLDHVTQDDMCNLRLVSREVAEEVAVKLFKSVKVTFDVGTFAHRARMIALDRIGHYIKHFHFNLPHSEATFLPPLIDPESLEEVSFQYEPQHVHTSRPSSSTSLDPEASCKYGSWELNDLLVRQYPPLFHAATNITTFIRVFNAMPFLRHLTISCPEQPANQRYRRNAIDYALISLRLAVEAVNPPFLDTLSLQPMYPSGIFYLRPHQGIGTSPGSTRVWHRIKHLDISMQNFAETEEEHDTTSDHLKILHTYLQTLRSVETLSFAWLNETGPCPLSLDAEPCLSRPSSLDSITSALPACRPIKFRKLRSIKLENALLDASQASRLITLHRKYIRDIDFSSCTLRSGTWDDALAPLEAMASNSDWRSETSSPCYSATASTYTTSSASSSSGFSEVMDVPIFYTPMEEMPNPFECVQELMWDETDRDVMRAVNKVATDVFRLRQAALPRKKRDVVVCGIRSLLRSVGMNFH